jgi:hypothetical protein
MAEKNAEHPKKDQKKPENPEKDQENLEKSKCSDLN